MRRQLQRGSECPMQLHQLQQQQNLTESLLEHFVNTHTTGVYFDSSDRQALVFCCWIQIGELFFPPKVNPHFFPQKQRQSPALQWCTAALAAHSQWYSVVVAAAAVVSLRLCNECK